MADSREEEDREKFYSLVRKRTAERWRDTYVTKNQSPKEEEKARKLLEKLKSKPESKYSINVCTQN